MRILPKILLILGILGLILGLSIYFFKTETVEAEDVPVKIDKATRYTKQGFISTDYYTEIQVEPTASTKPKVTYLLILDTGIMKNEYKVSWEQLELDIHKVKTVSIKISQDEYTALGMQPSYTTKIFEARPQHQMLYLVPGIVLLVAFISSYVLSRESIKRLKLEHGMPPPLDVTPTPKDRGAPNGKRWWVKPDGTTTDTPPYNASEPISYIVSEPMESQPVFHLGEDWLSKHYKNERTQAETEQIKEETELIKEIKEDIRDERQRRKWGRLWGRPWGRF